MERQTRREFLCKSFSGVALAAGGLTLLRPVLSIAAEAQQPPTARSYNSGKFGLEVDGQFAGWVASVEGGHATSDAVVEPTGAGGVQTKHIGTIRYEPIVVNSGFGMSSGYYQWIKASLAGQLARKNGAIVTCDFNFKEVSRLEWYNAFLTEIGFPACDASSKDPAMMTLKFVPEQTRMIAKPGATPYKNSAAVQKKWLPANFRLQIAGLDCSRVNKIEAISANLHSAASPSRLQSAQQAGLQPEKISNLVLTLPEASAESFYAWYKAAVVQGNTAQGQKSGRLEYLSSDLKSPLFDLTFPRLTILKWTPVRASAGVAAIPHVQVEMACTGLGFDWSAAA